MLSLSLPLSLVVSGTPGWQFSRLTGRIRAGENGAMGECSLKGEKKRVKAKTAKDRRRPASAPSLRRRQSARTGPAGPLAPDPGQRVAAAALQQETEMFMDLVNAQPVGIYRIRVFARKKWRPEAWSQPGSAPYCVELASERFCQILGVSRREFQGAPGIVEGLVHPEDKDGWVRRNTEANERLIPFEWEGRLVIDGRETWVHLESLPRPLADGDVLWTGFLQDISEHKRAQRRLRESEKRYEILASISPVGIFHTDAAGSTTYVNPAWCRIAGMDADQALGLGWLRAVHPDDRQRLGRGWREASSRQQASSDDYRLLRADGSLAWVMGRAVPEFDAEGRIVGYVGTITDITERKRAEQRLHESEERLRLLSDHLPGGMVYQIDSGPDGRERRLTYLSAGVEKLHGVPAADMLRDPMLLYAQLSPQDAEKVARLEAEAAAGMRPFRAEAQVRLPSGEVRWRLFISAPHRQDDGRLIWDGVEVDIEDNKRATAEREKMQSLFLQSQKMESIGRLAGGVAHELNNMLEVILIQAEMAMSGLPSGHPLQAGLQAIDQAAGRSAELTRQLLAFARRQAANPRRIDLNESVAGSLDMLRRLVGEDKALEWRPGKDLSPVLIDPQQLMQVLTNLCLNARDAIAGVGRITLATSRLRLDKAACAAWPDAVPGEYARLEVSDSGCGMPSEVQAQIFEPFYTTKPLGCGTGLGLPAVYGIIQQNHGFITVDSAPGRGSTFALLLPLQEGDVAAEEAPARWSGELRGSETVLVVEDEPAILEIVELLLRQTGYEVLAAGSPGAALRLAAERGNAIDLLLTDLVMPEMDGRELARRLEAGRPGLKRLFMSGHAADIVADHGLTDGEANFIAKPFTMDQLLAKVRETLGKG